MSEAVESQLRGFVAELIEQNGGLFDWPSECDSGQAILPPEVADRYGLCELVPLTTQSRGEGLCVSLASEFLDEAEHWLEAVPRVAAVQLPDAHLKGGDISEAVAKRYTWLNAKCQVAGSESVRTDYHTWWFHVQLASEDRWETRLSVSINAHSLAEVEFPDPFQEWELRPSTVHTDAATSFEMAMRAARRRVELEASGFLARMDARLERDRRRLNEYYNALRRESKQKSARARAPKDPEQAAAADQAVTLELRRKLAELTERYAMDAKLRPMVVVQTQLPALAVSLLIHRKQAKREHTIYWNALTKAFDPIPCSVCHRGAYSVAFTNEQVAPLCARCSK